MMPISPQDRSLSSSQGPTWQEKVLICVQLEWIMYWHVPAAPYAVPPLKYILPN
jgi:mutS1: DNA mismatch repair protein MutS